MTRVSKVTRHPNSCKEVSLRKCWIFIHKICTFFIQLIVTIILYYVVSKFFFRIKSICWNVITHNKCLQIPKPSTENEWKLFQLCAEIQTQVDCSSIDKCIVSTKITCQKIGDVLFLFGGKWFLKLHYCKNMGVFS